MRQDLGAEEVGVRRLEQRREIYVSVTFNLCVCVSSSVRIQSAVDVELLWDQLRAGCSGIS